MSEDVRTQIEESTPSPLSTDPSQGAVNMGVMAEHYQRVVEDQTDLICRYRTDFTLTYVNGPYAALFGQTPAAMIGYNLLATIPPEYQAQVAAHLAALTPAQPIGSFENPLTLADGSQRWFHWTNRLILAADDAPLAYQGVGRDITSRKRAEEAEREQRLFAEAMRDSLAALTSSLAVPQVMSQVLASAARVVPSDAGSIILAEGTVGRLAYLRGFNPAATATLQDYRFPLVANPWADLLASRQPYFVADTATDPHWLIFPAAEWIRSSIGVPIVVRDKVAGVLMANSAQPQHFQQQDVEKLQAFAHYAALALENAYHATQLEARVAARTQELLATQAALAEERNILRTLIDAMPDYIYAKDRQHRFMLSNVAHARDRGFRLPDELLGKTDYDLFPTEMAEQFWNEEEAIFADGAPLLDHEQPSVGYGGGFAWALSNKIPVRNLNGEIVGLVGITRDITERKARERQLRYHASLQQTVRDAVIVTDLQMSIQSWNPAAEALYGWRAEEVIGRRVSEVLQTRFPANITSQRPLHELFHKGWWRGEVNQNHRDGTPLYFLSSVTLLKDDRGIPFGVVAVNHDITELKAAQEAMQIALDKEKELSELKSRFVSMASHEFRTPLATILALTESLSAYRGQMSEEQIEDRLQKIQTQISYLKNVMEDVLQLARLQARRAEFNPTWLNLDALCRSVIDEFQSRPEVLQRLHYTCADPTYAVELDSKLVRQILQNLVSNAVKYSSEPSAVSITLSYVTSAASSAAVLRVQDQGIGIPASDLPHLYTPFHRAANVGTQAGTGLGLTIVKESVELHQGTITVDSIVDQGTTFTVTLPTQLRRPA